MEREKSWLSTFVVAALGLYCASAFAQTSSWNLVTRIKEGGEEATLQATALRPIVWDGKQAIPVFRFYCSRNWADVGINWKIKGIVGKHPIFIRIHSTENVAASDTIELNWNSVGVEYDSVLFVGERATKLVSSAVERAALFHVSMQTPDGQTILAQFSGSPLSNDTFRAKCGGGG